MGGGCGKSQNSFSQSRRVWNNVEQNKETYTLFTGARPKIILLSNKDLLDSRGDEQKGDPKNEGKSNDVYENKGQFFCDFSPETMSMKTSGLYFSSNDVYENKWFS